MRILLASVWALHGGGGIPTYCSILERELTRRGHQVDAIWREAGEESLHHSDGRVLQDAAFAPRVDPRIAAVDEGVRFAERRRYLLELAAGETGLDGYDVIHTQDSIASRALARVRPHGVAQVATLHGEMVKEFEIGFGEKFNPLMRRYFSREEFLGATSPHRVIVPSAALRRQIAELAGVPPQRLRVMPYGLDLGALEAASGEGEAPGAGRDCVVLLCPARLDPVKGHADLLQALAMIVQAGGRVELWLAGTGAIEAELRELASSLHLEGWVRFLGERDDVAALIRRSDAVVLASIQESLSFALLEAQALGKAVVATRALGIPEAVEDGVSGILCEPGRPEELARALRRVVDDEPLRLRLGRAGARRAKELFTADRMADEVLDVYRDATEAAKAEGETPDGRACEIPDPEIWPLP